MIPTTRTGTRLLAGTAMAAVLLTTPAVLAQDTEVEDPPADATTQPEGIEDGGLDFGGTVIVDEDGTVRWNVDADTNTAADDPDTPSSAPAGGGVSGTGTIDTGSPARPDDTAVVPDDGVAPTGNKGSTPLDSSNASGTGNQIWMLLGIGGGVVAMLVAVGVVLRSRRNAADDEAVVEDVLGGPFSLDDDLQATEAAEPAYAGATDAGAYQEGGAAYAQYTEPVIDVPEPVLSSSIGRPSIEARNRLDQLRLSMSDVADRKLVDAGQHRVIAQKLEGAGSQMRPGEWLVMTAGATVSALFLCTFVLGWLIGILAGVLTAMGFWMALTAQESKRQKLFADTLPETLQLISGSLRGGLSMMQAIQTVAEEADEPTAAEFHRVVTESRLGRDLAVSFRDLAGRMGSKDFEWVVTAIEIHREVGGDLAGILDRVGDTIRARNRVRGQVKALSAEGRMSGLVLFFLPPGMVGAIALLNRPYLNEMLNASEGQIMLVVSIVLLLIGGAWLRRLSRFVF